MREPSSPSQSSTNSIESDERTITGWKGLFHRLGLSTESVLERVRDRVESRFRPDRPVQIVAYRGFGTNARAHLKGRVLSHSERQTDDAEGLWKSLADSYRRFETDELAGERVLARYAERSVEAVSDDEGYVEFDLQGPFAVTSGKATIELSLPDRSDAPVTTAELMIPDHDVRFGVISDIDDTIMLTEATSILKMMRLTLLQSSESRLAFPGVAEFYRALHQDRNPFFYVSSSPWNLYEFLEDFMQLKGIVAGPIQLRDFGLDRNKFIAGPHHDHKLEAIRRVLDCYPEISFVLIGDSGQDDAGIYREIVEQYPNRVLAVYIRDVSDDVRDAEIRTILEDIVRHEVPAVMVPDTLAAAVHASGLGLIDEDRLDAIARGVEDDQRRHAALDDQVA